MRHMRCKTVFFDRGFITKARSLCHGKMLQANAPPRTLCLDTRCLVWRAPYRMPATLLLFPNLRLSQTNDSARYDAGHALKTFKQAKHLCAAIPTHQRVNLINHNKAKVSKQTHNILMPVPQHRLQRFRRYRKMPEGCFIRLSLCERSHPHASADRDIRFIT